MTLINIFKKEILASKLNLDSELAFNYGLLHDYGRKYHHDFRHVTSGFHELKNIPESRATLTHSFINGGNYNKIAFIVIIF